MTRKEAFDSFYNAALPLYGEREARSVAYYLMEGLYGVQRVDMALEARTLLDSGLRADAVAAQVAAGRPVQYITGKAYFCGLPLEVDKNVLIPRPETEELVTWVLSEAPQGATVLDIGTGSGAIAVALAAALPGARIVAMDISLTALATAGRNAAANRTYVEFRQADALVACEAWSGRWESDSFDVIVSNPPYIPATDRDSLSINVRDYEPAEALFVDEQNPLVFYKAVADHAAMLLKPAGSLYFEIYELYGERLVRLMEECGFADVELRRDINGKHRMLRCRKRT